MGVVTVIKGKPVVALILLASFFVTAIAPAYAQTVSVLGEIKSSGTVYVAATNGQWLQAMQSYPILPNTAIKTKDGMAAFLLKDTCRVDVNRNSSLTFNGLSPSVYTISIAEGTVAFNIKAGASLTITTPTATVNVNSPGAAAVVKVSETKDGRIIGAVTVSEKGTEVRSISGRIVASHTGGEAKVVVAGESAFIGNDSKVKIYTTQAVAQSGDDDRKAAALLMSGSGGTNYVPAYIIGGLMAGAVTVISFDVWRGSGKKSASPSGF